MVNHFLMFCKNIKWYDLNRTLKKAVLKRENVSFFGNMKDKKRTEILLKGIERVYSKNPGIQTLIHICKEEGVSSKQVFFSLLLALL